MFVMRKYIWCYLWINNDTRLQHEKCWYQALISLHFIFRLTIDRLENEKKEIQHELHIYKQQSSGTQVNIGGDYGCDIRLKIILVLKECISIERQPIWTSFLDTFLERNTLLRLWQKKICWLICHLLWGDPWLADIEWCHHQGNGLWQTDGWKCGIQNATQDSRDGER